MSFDQEQDDPNLCILHATRLEDGKCLECADEYARSGVTLF